MANWIKTLTELASAAASVASGQEAARRTQQAHQALASLVGILEIAVTTEPVPDWESLKDNSRFAEPEPERPADPVLPREPLRSDAKYAVEVPPRKPLEPSLPPEPVRADSRYRAQPATSRDGPPWELKRITAEGESEMELLFAKEHAAWAAETAKLRRDYVRRLEEYEAWIAADMPLEPPPPVLPSEPQPNDVRYALKLSISDRLSPSRTAEKKAEAQALYGSDHRLWKSATEQLLSEHSQAMQSYLDRLRPLQEAAKTAKDLQFASDHDAYEAAVKGILTRHEDHLRGYRQSHARWVAARSEYAGRRDHRNQEIDRHKAMYPDRDPGVVLDFSRAILAGSPYSESLSQAHDAEYNASNGVLVVDYLLPSIDDIPTLWEVKYIEARDEFRETHLSESDLTTLYDDVLYKIALRTIYLLFESDFVGAVTAVAFNGYVHTIDRATGKEIIPCILSVQATKQEFQQINLAQVDAEACFKKLKGVSGRRLHNLTPVAPLLRIEKTDRRFTAGYDVIAAVQEGDNLAAMDWEDFEHLIRELFEEEFSSPGSEVKVTRASRDGGVDAVIFDPDPLHGGKTVVQAKRYTNTVGVSAVRDLYGTVHNEGANKGILVTTSDYGPDAYEFAKGKPLALLNGGNLLHLLEKHGHKARIDLSEAKALLARDDR